MSAILLVALFATVAAVSAITLADAAVRGRTAVRVLRGDLARQDMARLITVTIDSLEGPRMPALRTVCVSASRLSPRRTVRAAVPMRAAA